MSDNTTPPPRFTAQQSRGRGAWFVFDGTAGRFVAQFNLSYSDPRGAARAEAARLNALDTQQ